MSANYPDYRHDSYADERYYGPVSTMDEGEERTWTVLAHLSAPIAAILSAGSLSLLGPLVIYFLVRKRSPLARNAAAGAFNFNVSFWVLYVVAWVLIFTVIAIPVAVAIWLVIFVVSAITHIIGAIRGARGEYFTYPFQIKILR